MSRYFHFSSFVLLLGICWRTFLPMVYRKWRSSFSISTKILAMSLHFPMPKIRTIAVTSHFPLPKIRTLRFSLHTSCLSFLKWSPLWRWNSQWVPTFRCQKNSPSLFQLSLEWREPRDEWSKTQDKWSNSTQSNCSSHRKKMNRTNNKNYWK